MNYLANDILNQPWLILLLIILIFGVIAGGVFLLRKFLNRNKEKEEIDEKACAEESLSRYLEDVKDPETLKQFDEYKDKEEDDK